MYWNVCSSLIIKRLVNHISLIGAILFQLDVRRLRGIYDSIVPKDNVFNIQRTVCGENTHANSSYSLLNKTTERVSVLREESTPILALVFDLKRLVRQ